MPCPVRIDIIAVQRCLAALEDTEDPVPPALQAQYDAMRMPAKACMVCGRCVNHCPNAVPIHENMQLADEIFRKRMSFKA